MISVMVLTGAGLAEVKERERNAVAAITTIEVFILSDWLVR